MIIRLILTRLIRFKQVYYPIGTREKVSLDLTVGVLKENFSFFRLQSRFDFNFSLLISQYITLWLRNHAAYHFYVRKYTRNLFVFVECMSNCLWATVHVLDKWMRDRIHLPLPRKHRITIIFCCYPMNGKISF